MRAQRYAFGLVPLLALGLALGGCSTSLDEVLPDRTLDYKKSREAGENLELPPDIKGAKFDDAMDVPSAGGAATYSDYQSGRARRAQTVSSGEVLPTTAGVQLVHSGNERWLVVDAPPQQVWTRVVSFWRQQGLLLVEQDPAVGTMKTDWLQNRAEIPQDFITRAIRKVAEGLYSTGTRDQYQVRLDTGPKPGTTEIHLTHKGMIEKLDTGTLGDTKRTVWEPSGTDPEKEAAMLRRLMLYLGAPANQANAALAGTGSAGPARAAASPARVEGQGPSQVLVINEEYRRGWRMVGSALDRAGFAVEDRDMSQGLYYVRYQDVDAGRGAKRSFWSRMAFWKKEDIDKVKQYKLKLEGTETQTRVRVLDDKGNPDGSASAGRILALLAEQMT